MGISSTDLAEIAVIPKVFAVGAPEQVRGDPMADFAKRREEVEKAREGSKPKPSFVEAEVISVIPREEYFYGVFWGLCDYSNEHLFCEKCRSAPELRTRNTDYQWSCIRCSANSYAAQNRYSVEDMREKKSWSWAPD